MKSITERTNKLKVNPRYDLTVGELYKLNREAGDGLPNLIYLAFKFGYLRGAQAAHKTERRGSNE